MEEALQLLNRLFFLMIGWVTHASTAGNEAQLRENEVMLRFLQLVKQHYREHHEVAFYADKMNISAKYMTTLIKKASGKSALQWIEDYVILDAKAQLSSTVNTIQQITFDLNFPSQSIFGRYFKRAVGMSPSEYRASLRVYQIAKQEQ
jgi:AraC-like DNA-binding protein